MAACNIRECSSSRPPGCQNIGARDSVARSAAVAGACLGVACLTIRRRTSRNGIHSSVGNVVGMATAYDAAGEGGCPGCRQVCRAGIREGMRWPAHNVDRAVYMLCRIGETRARGVDMWMTIDALSRSNAAMRGDTGRVAMARAASGRGQIIRLAPDG